MNNTTEQLATNDLRFSTSKTVGKKTIYVKIRLNDECKNGHQDFSITGDIYEAGKPKIDRYHLCGGCIHDDIEKYFPQFIPFIKLHLCDYKGIPMHAGANGYYHLRQGFNNTKPNSDKFKGEYCDYYRITTDQFNQLNSAENELQFCVLLDRLGILLQWEIEANEAIKQLEQLTGKTFIVDSKRTQFVAPTKEQLEEEEKRQAEGYYTPEQKAIRIEQKKQSEVAKLEADRDKIINNANREFQVKKAVLLIGGKQALDNCIFYNHTDTLAFNWKSYDNLPDEVIETIVNNIQLPEGVKIKKSDK